MMTIKRNFEFKVIVILMIVFILVLFTGVVTYDRFSNIVNRISEASRPDLRLVSAKSLENDLALLGNNAKTYSLTSDTIYLERFFATATNIETQTNVLEEMNRKSEDDDLNIVKLDSLISEKFAVLNELLFSQDQFRVQAALTKVVSTIEKSSKGNHDSKSIVVEETIDEKPRRKLLGWINRKKKTDDDAELYVPDNALIEVKKVNKEIKQIQSEEMRIENRLKDSELQLITLDNKLTKEITSFLDKFETSEQKRIQFAAAMAEEEASKTNRQIAVFCILVGVLLIFIVYLILKYVNRNNLYKIALKKSKLESEALARTRERFMANISHEIRTPMNAISGFADQLHESQLTKRQREFVQMIQKSSEHLIYLINDVLDFSKLQNGKLKLEKSGFKIRDVAHEVTTFSKQLSQDKNVEVSCLIHDDVPQILIGDSFRLRQILLNLMSNAVKFTTEGSVRLIIGLKHDLLQIQVKDSGIGMDEETLERVFLEFEQASAGTAKNHGGTGLGLSISKMIVEMMEGRLILESKENSGTTAFVEIPTEIGILDDLNLVAIDSIQLSIKSVLIVDDEDFNRKLLMAIFDRHKISYQTANNGQEAVECVENNSFDMILMDARMPIMDGVEATRVIRLLNNRVNKVKIIALTAAVSEVELIEFKKAGMNGYLAKPFKEIDLLVEIERICLLDTFFLPEIDNVETINAHNTSKVDLDIMRKISGGDNSFFIDMLETFVKSTKDGMKVIEIGYLNNDWAMIANESHKISSPCKHLGADDLYFMLKRIENITRSRKETVLIKEALKSLQNEVDEVISEIEKELLRLNTIK